MIDDLIKKAVLSHVLSKEEIVELLKAEGNSHDKLILAADSVRHKYVGDDVHLRGLIEFSNICKQNCLYCGLRRDNEKIKRYRLEPEQIIAFAKNASDLGYKTIVLQSGEDSFYTVERLVFVISEIKKFDVAITLSIGEKTFE